jgi:hypothetical protein
MARYVAAFRLTPQGRMLLERAIPAWSEAQQQVKRVLGDGAVKSSHEARRQRACPELIFLAT